MPGRNLAKPFAIVAFFLAEIYLAFTVFAPYGRETHALPFVIPDKAPIPAGTPAPIGTRVTEFLVLTIFFGPFGALVGTGVGLLTSGLLGDFRPKQSPTPPA